MFDMDIAVEYWCNGDGVIGYVFDERKVKEQIEEKKETSEAIIFEMPAKNTRLAQEVAVVMLLMIVGSVISRGGGAGTKKLELFRKIACF